MPPPLAPAALRAALAATLLAGACARAAGPPAAAVAPPEAVGETRTVAFRCETGELFEVRFSERPETATILDAQGERVLAAEPTGSGYLYQSPMASLRGKGQDLRYAVGRRAATACVEAPRAQLQILRERQAAGAVVRALGQEPGWIAEVMADGRIEAGLDYGQRRLATPPATHTGAAGGTRQSWAATSEAGPLALTIEAAPCADSMSEDRYWFTATLRVGEQTLKGCAQPLR